MPVVWVQQVDKLNMSIGYLFYFQMLFQAGKILEKILIVYPENPDMKNDADWMQS